MKRIKVFLASSEELRSDREQFEIFINRKNKEWFERELFIELVIWEDFLDAMSQTRLQDEYNKAIRECEIFVMLFFTKVGMYTAEEFGTAFGHFKETNKPLIFTYFKDAPISTGMLNQEDLRSLFAFQDKLKDLGHFSTLYKNIEDLRYHFDKQLDRLWLQPSIRTEQSTSFQNGIANLNNLTAFTLTIDEKILAALRDMQNLPANRKSAIYEDILKGNLVEKNTTLGSCFTEDLPCITERLVETILDEVVVRVEIDTDLQRIVYKCGAFELEVEKPLLTWDCHCSIPDGVIPEAQTTRVSKEIPCPIHGHPAGKALTQVYRSQLRLISFGGTSVLFKTSPEFWPPTIDSFMMYQNLVDDGILGKHYRSVLDLGCGTGFLGIHLGLNNPHIRTIYLADWLLTPLVYCMMSWKLNRPPDDKITMHPLLGLNLDWVPRGSAARHFDLCVCNPPYLPARKEFPEITIHHTVGGTELLEEVIRKGTELARATYVNFSDIAIDEAQLAADRSGKRLEQVGRSLRVPFTVPQAFNYPDYIKHLVDENRLIEDEESRYRYWHNIGTYLVRDI